MQRAIVQRLACFESPTEIQAALRETYGAEVSLSQVAYYNPLTATTDLAPEWRALFDETRKRFVESTADIAIAHRSVRLRDLERMKAKAERMGNLALAKDLLEQAAKEVGDVYTNRRGLAVAQATSIDDLIRAAAGLGDPDEEGDGDGAGA